MRVLINSRDRAPHQTTTQFTYRLPTLAYNTKCLRLRYYAIYDSSYIVEPGLSITAGGTTITVNPGNYTPDELATELTTGPLTTTYDARLGKFRFTHTSGTTWQLVVPPRLRRVLGVVQESTTSDNTGTLISPAMAQVTTTPYYLLVFKNLPVLGSQVKPYHFVIMNEVGITNMNTPRSFPHEEYVSLEGLDIAHLDIELRDQDYEIVDTNNVDWTLELEFL